jgi:hypothetical protein
LGGSCLFLLLNIFCIIKYLIIVTKFFILKSKKKEKEKKEIRNKKNQKNKNQKKTSYYDFYKTKYVYLFIYFI